MKNKLMAAALVGAVLGAAGFGGVVVASSGATNDGQAVSSMKAAAAMAAAPKAKAKFARLAAFVLADGTVAYSKGVESVTTPALGTFCIQPKRTVKIDLERVVPSLTVDWSNSSGNALMAHWRSSGFGCPPGNIEVLTINGSGGTFDIDGGVAFTIVVP